MAKKKRSVKTAPVAQSAQPGALPDYAKIAAQMALIVVAGVVIYSGTIHYPFVFDDEFNVVTNPALRDFGFFAHPSRIRDVTGLEPDVVENFITRYVANLSFAVNFSIGGLNPAGYHIFNIGVHIINGLLVYWMVSAVMRAPVVSGKENGYIPLFAALLFVCHPMSTQAVTYITQRFASLAAMFYLASVAAYITWRLDERRWFYYPLAMVSAVAGMFTKENAVTIPLMIALAEFMFFDGALRQRLRKLAPLLVIILIIPVTLLLWGRALTSGLGVRPFTRWEYFYTQFGVVLTYLRLLIAPVGQNLDYDYPLAKSFLSIILNLLALTAIFAGGAVCARRGGKWRLTAFGIFWFFVAVSVESSFFPIGEELIYEHRAYLPLVGISITAVSLAWMVNVRWGIYAMSALVLVYSGAAYNRNKVWQNEISLWEDCAAKSPGKPRPLINLGAAYERAGRTEEAERVFRNAAEIDSRFYPVIYRAIAHNHLGVLYGNRGRPADAAREFGEALRLHPDYAEARDNLAIAAKALGR